MTDIQIFSNPQFGEIRTAIGENGEPMFCLADVCKALEIKNTSDVKTRLKEDGVGTAEVIDALGRTQTATFVSEANLYKCIFQSRVAKAEQFQDWVCDEVLPTIRKTGGYILANADDTPEVIMARAVIVAQATIEKQNKQLAAQNATIEEQSKTIDMMKPKAAYYDTILNNPHTLNTTSIASDYGMTPQKFNKLLHSLGIQKKVGGVWIPFAKYISQGYTKISTEPNPNSKHGNSYTYSKWTQRGRLFLYETLKKKGVLPLIER